MNYEIINITGYNPNNSIFKTGRSDREEIKYWKCCNKENCEAYKNGRCVMFYKLFMDTSCPYGFIEKNVGFTKASRKCGELNRKAKSKYPDKYFILKDETGFAKIGQYIFIPISYIRDVRNPFYSKESDFWYQNNERMINIKYYTPEMLKQLCLYRPLTFFSATEIKDYQDKVLPEFLQRLKRYDINMYQELLEIYPEAESIANKFSFIGKKAMLDSLSIGKIKLNTHLCEWNGKIVKFLDNPVLFGEKGVYYFEPDPNAVATICDEKTVNENTIIID